MMTTEVVTVTIHQAMKIPVTILIMAVMRKIEVEVGHLDQPGIHLLLLDQTEKGIHMEVLTVCHLLELDESQKNTG